MIGIKKIALILLSTILCINSYCQYAAVSFYIVAHPDQWQLFMGNDAFNDIVKKTGNEQSKVMLIYTTAGDESYNGNTPDPNHYLAREEGARNSVEFCADIHGDHIPWVLDRILVRGHSILKYTYKNVVSYLLRLPDGCNGNNISGQSLQLLHDSLVQSITTVDSTTTYSGWADLDSTLREIVGNEAANAPHLYFNTADADTATNQGDDPDNIYAGKLCMDAIAGMQGISLKLFQENKIANLPVNLNDKDIATKAALLSQIDYVRTMRGLPTAWTTLNLMYLSRNYFRTITK